jgi:23S rRNA (pseudouridine1915-N3)-methyltransferase
LRWIVLAVGRARPPDADDHAHNQRLLRRQADVEVVEVREVERLARRIPERAHVGVMDAGGCSYDSRACAGWVPARR